ncbi:hypothetical protein IKF89_02495 [Candidatus Saccharibacteria bacterium]|nr:hypothetical protein [Candidatus Saccharibacteria bacterium]
MHKLGNFLTIGGLVGVTVASGAVLSMSTVSATDVASDSKSSTASVTVKATCSMTANVTTEHTATLPNGIWSGDYTSGGVKPYENGIGSTTIQTFCNDPNGYGIYAVGFTGGTTTPATAGKNTVLHSSALGDNYDIETGVYSSGDTTSKWSMKLAKVTDSSQSYLPNNLSILNSYDSYHAVPATYQKVANYSSATDATLGSKLTTTYGAYISGTQPAGTYTGQVKYTLVHPSSGSMPSADNLQDVQYWGGSLVVGEEKTVVDGRDGKSYTVARLCTNYDGDNCTTSQLWMTQNLDLQIGGTYNGNPIELTSENTNLTTAYAADGTTLLNGYSVDSDTGVITWTPSGNATVTGTPATISDFEYHNAEATNVSGWSNQNYLPYQAEGQLNGNDVYMYTSGTTGYDTVYGTLSACTTAGHTAAECAHYKIGNYYNFTAANAMNDSTAYTAQYTVMPNSICPAGWRLPKGITNGGTTISEFNKLLKAQGVTNGEDLAGSTNTQFTTNGFNMIRTTGKNGDPLYFVRSGDVNGTTLWNARVGGYYWSSTVATPSTHGYYLSFSSGGVWPAYQYYRNSGRSVRCVAE